MPEKERGFFDRKISRRSFYTNVFRIGGSVTAATQVWFAGEAKRNFDFAQKTKNPTELETREGIWAEIYLYELVLTVMTVSLAIGSKVIYDKWDHDLD